MKEMVVRPPVAAGTFYGASPSALHCQLEMVKITPSPERVHACMVPHAGFVFSMPVAMRALGQASAQKPERAVILGPSHRFAFAGAAAADFSAWRTPFGDMPCCQEALELIGKNSSRHLYINNEYHTGEHSIEVELPLLYQLFGALPIVPIVVGNLDMAGADALGAALAALDTPGTLWVISGDFTHYGQSFRYTPYGIPVSPEKLTELDREAAELIAAKNLDGFARFLGRTRATICGVNPAAAYLKMVEHSGREVKGEVTEVTDSGAVTGDYNHVVGYAGIVFKEVTE